MSCLTVALLLTACLMTALAQPTGGVVDTNLLRWETNGPAVLRVVTNPPPITYMTNSEGVVRPRPWSRLWPRERAVFDHFLPNSLNNLAWASILARTNGRTPVIWSVRQHPPGWPTNAPQVQWNTNSLIWGMKGLTALSPCWEKEYAPGMVPITALTRRHGYTRGHSMGPDGFNTNFAGFKVWFVTADNKIVMRKVLRDVVRTVSGSSTNDYTILLFDQDLPADIESIRVAAHSDVLAKCADRPGAPWPILFTEQLGRVASLQVPGFWVEIAKGGDSGSPNLVPLGGELVFFSGRSTSGPSAQMQSDMDALCRAERLNPKRYQLNWADLSSYPSFPKTASK